jgi:hypothetical protein
MKREYNIRILLGIVLLLLGIAVETIWNGVYSPLTSGFVGGIAILIWLFHVLKLSPSLTPSEDMVTGAVLVWVVGLYYFLVLKWYHNKKGESN